MALVGLWGKALPPGRLDFSTTAQSQPNQHMMPLAFFLGRAQVAHQINWGERLHPSHLPPARRPWERVAMPPSSTTLGLSHEIMKRTFGFRQARQATIVPECYSGSFKAEHSEESGRHIKRQMTNSDHIHITRTVSQDGETNVQEGEYETCEYMEGPMQKEEVDNLIYGAKKSVALHFIRFMELKTELPFDVISLIRNGTYYPNLPAKRPTHSEHWSPANIRLYNQRGSFRFVRDILPIIFRPKNPGEFSSQEDITMEAYHTFWRHFLTPEQASALEKLEAATHPREAARAFDLSVVEERTEPEVSYVFAPPASPTAESRSSQRRLSKLEKASLRWNEEQVTKMRTSLPTSAPPGLPLMLPLENHRKRSLNLSFMEESLTKRVHLDNKSDTEDAEIDEESTVSGSPPKISRPCAPTPSRWIREEPATPRRLSGISDIDQSGDHMSIDGSLMDFGLPSSKIDFERPGWVNHTSTAPWVQDGSRSKERSRSLRRKSEPAAKSILRNQTRPSSSPRKRVSFAATADRSSPFVDLVSKYADSIRATEHPSPSKGTPQMEENPEAWDPTIDSLAFTPIAYSKTAHRSAENHSTPTKEGMQDAAVTKATPDLPERIHCTKDSETEYLTPIQNLLTVSPNNSYEYQTPTHGILEASTPSQRGDQSSTRLEHIPKEASSSHLASYLAGQSNHTPSISHAIQATPTPRPQRVLDLDMRYQLNLFGTPRMPGNAPVPAPVQRLAEMAQHGLDGHASKIVVEEVGGRLFVRFKLSAEFAHLFPANQGDDESHFSTSPSAHGTPRRVTFDGRALGQQSTAMSSSPLPQASASLVYDDQSLMIPEPDDVEPNSTANAGSEMTFTSFHPSPAPSYQSEVNQSQTTFAEASSMLAAPSYQSEVNQSQTTVAESSMLAAPSYQSEVNQSQATFAEPSSVLAAPSPLRPTKSAMKGTSVSPKKRVVFFDETPPIQTIHFRQATNNNRLALNVGSFDSPGTQSHSADNTTLVRTPQFQRVTNDEATLVMSDFDSSTAQSHDVDNTTPTTTRQLDSVVGEDSTVVMGEFDSPTVQLREEIEYYTPRKAAEQKRQQQLQMQMQDDAISPAPLSLQASSTDDDVALNDDEEKTVQVQNSLVETAGDEDSSEEEQRAAPGEAEDVTATSASNVPTLMGSEQVLKEEENRDISFTPVNPSPRPSPPINPDDAAQNTANTVSNPAYRRSQREDDDDRAYMMDFVNQSRRKKRSAPARTTATGSPVAQQETRAPLGAKSPNTSSPSPQKGKRKHAETEGNESPEKVNATPKKKSRTENGTKKANLPTAELAPLTPPPARRPVEAEGDEEEEADELGAEPEKPGTVVPTGGPTMRRSTRVRTPAVPTSSTSSIPTAIKVGRAGTVLKSGRSEQQDYAYLTRANTRNNRGDAEYPAETLTRLGLEKQEDEGIQTEISPDDGGKKQKKCTMAKGTKGKAVAWKTPLASYQEEEPAEEEKPKKGRPAATEKKKKQAPMVTFGTSGIAKPKATGKKAGAPAKGAAQAAEKLGMVANGTPAKPRRATRASSRTTKK